MIIKGNPIQIGPYQGWRTKKLKLMLEKSNLERGFKNV